MNSNIFLARQPVLDRDQLTFGYELLYRDGPDTVTFFRDPDDATRCVIERTLLHWGMERIIGDRFGFINASSSLILSGLHRALPPEGIIIELREETPYDGPTIDALVRARRDGYHFALDNVSRLEHLERSRALPHVHMVKVELSRTDPADVPRLVEMVRSTYPKALLVAEKVEDAADYALSSEAGFDLFQGFFFARPELLSRAARPANAASAMALLAEIQRGDIDIDRVEHLVGSDPSLAYRLLAVVNSSAFGLDRRVDSLRHAIVLLGVNQVRHLATLLALSASKDANEELITLGAARARLAGDLVANHALKSGAFTAGLLSITDALYRTPMDELLADLPVSTEIERALVAGEGPIGEVLRVVKACEQADLELLEAMVPGRIEEVMHAYAAATQWADAMRAQLISVRSRTTLPSDTQPVHV